MVEYRKGQVWRTSFGATLTVLVVEDVRRIGKIVHVRVDNVPGESCGNIRLTTELEHLAVPEKMMRKSTLYLIKDNVDIPDSYLDDYRDWVKQKKREIVKVPLEEKIRVGGWMICNFVPNQT